MEHTNGHSVVVAGNGENHSTEEPEAFYSVVLAVAVFLFLIIDVFLFGERMLEVNLILLLLSMLIYALHATVYLIRNRRKFRLRFLLSTSISGVLSFLFWNVYEIWSVKFGELLFGIMIVSLFPLGVFFLLDDTKGGTTKADRGAVYSIPTCIAVFVLLAVVLAPPLNITIW